MTVTMKPVAGLRCALGVLALALPASVAFADDKTPPTKPTVQFRDFPDQPCTKYTLTLTAEVAGANEKLVAVADILGGFPAPGLANFYQEHIKDIGPGWKCAAGADGALVIEGWTDAKTGKFYPTKMIRAECPGLPKESRPIVKLPPKA